MYCPTVLRVLDHMQIILSQRVAGSFYWLFIRRADSGWLYEKTTMQIVIGFSRYSMCCEYSAIAAKYSVCLKQSTQFIFFY